MSTVCLCVELGMACCTCAEQCTDTTSHKTFRSVLKTDQKVLNPCRKDGFKRFFLNSPISPSFQILLVSHALQPTESRY